MEAPPPPNDDLSKAEKVVPEKPALPDPPALQQVSNIKPSEPAAVQKPTSEEPKAIASPPPPPKTLLTLPGFESDQPPAADPEPIKVPSK